jgi:hypothetical protein
MIISGNTHRNIVRDNKFSAELGLSFQNCTGASEFGFSGESKTYKFSFISGKAFDHENRYFSSYLPNSQLNISTNLSGEAYDYSVDGDRVVYSGYKQNFFAERFYFKTTGCNIDASLTIKAQKPTCVLNIPANFYSGQLITGYVTTNSLSGIRVFSGSFENQSSFYFNNINTGYIKSNTSGEVLIGQNVTGLGNFITSFTLNTSAGDYNQQISITGLAVPYLDYAFEIDSDLDIINNLSTQTFESGVEKIGSANLNYSYDTNYGNLTPSSLPIDISLSYYSGVTGYFGQVSEVSVVSGGYGYLSPPTVIFSGGFTGNQARGLNASTNQFRTNNSVPFTFSSGQTIAFYKPSGITLPSPLQENYTYYVRDTFLMANTIFTISTGYDGPIFDITNTGSGFFYFYDPTKVASATAILGTTSVDYTSVVDVVMNYYGSGYSSMPTVLFSGGTGVVNNLNPIVASGIAELSFYTKSFSGFFNLSTGIDDNLINYRDNSYVSGFSYRRTGSSISDSYIVNITASYTPSFDNEIMVAKLSISGVNNNLIERYVTGAK